MANAPLRQPLLHGKHILVKADLGTKRACPSCNARFYDLAKRPIECPKCGFSYEPEALFKQRRSRAVETADAGAINAADTEAEEEEPETAEGMQVVEGEEDVAIEDIEVEDDEDEEDDDLLGEVEDEEEDVSGIIDPGISKDES